MATNPLDNLAAGKPAGWDSNFRVPPMPRLRESMSGNKLLDGLAAHDQANEFWRRNLEKSIEERIKATASATAAVSTPAAQPAPGQTIVQTTVVTSGVKTVNGEAGDVSLQTDKVPEGATNKYMTESGWQDFYDKDGYGRNYIAASETIRIPTNRNRVNTGPLVIDGILIIDGYFTAV